MAMQQSTQLLSMLLLLAGCASTRTPAIPASVSATPSEASVEKDLALAQALWQSSAPKNYTLTVRYSEFALGFGCSLQSFRVTGTRVKSVGPSHCGARRDKLGSVPALFAFASELLDRRMGEASAKFDPVYGYPRKFYVGRPDMDDAYLSFEVVKFSPEDPG